jgi:hypothetical protein
MDSIKFLLNLNYFTMRKIILLFSLMAVSLGYSQSFPIDFEDPLDANAVGGDSGVFNVIADPDAPSEKVGEFTNCCEDFSNMQLVLAEYIDLSDDSNNTITFRIKPQFGTGTNGAPPAKHLLKFEDGTAGNAEYEFTTTGTDWQVITADFGPGLGNYSKMVLIPDAFQSALNDTYLIDDFAGATNIGPPVAVLPFDFSDPDQIFLGSGCVVTMEVDPDDSTNDVMQIIVGSGLFDRASIELSELVNLSDDNNNTISFRMKPLNGTGSNGHQFKVENGTSIPNDFAIDFFTDGTTNWQNITIDFPEDLGNFGKLVIIPDLNSNMADTYLIDDMMGATNFQLPADPTTPSPTPNAPDSEVLSIYGDTGGFTNIWTPDYNFGDFIDEIDLDPSAAENFAIKMDFNEQGYGQGTNAVTDISAYNYLHLDYYTGYATQLRIILIEDDGAIQEYFYELPTDEPFVYDTWTGIDIDLSFFVNQGFSKDKFFQYKIGTESNLNPGIVFYDNLYFHENVLGTNDFEISDVSIYPNPTSDVWNISTVSQEIISVDVYDVLGKNVLSVSPNSTEALIDGAALKSGLYFAQVNTNTGVRTFKLLKK